MFERFSFLLSIIQRAGRALKSARYSQDEDLCTQTKGLKDLVTAWDLKTEKILISQINQRFPDDRILAEESSAVASDDPGITWIIDPIDGTTNFVHGLPIFGVSIAVLAKQKIHMGAVFNPAQNELFYAYSGSGAYLNNIRLPQLQPPPISEALLAAGFSHRKGGYPKQEQCLTELFTKVQSNVHAIRHRGAAALELCYVAAGWLDGYFEMGLHPWDVAAGMCIAREVGAQTLTYKGKPATPFDRQIICAPDPIATTLVSFTTKLAKPCTNTHT